MTTTLDTPIAPIRSLSVCKSHLCPFAFVSTTVFFLCINACSHTQSGPNHRRQARKKGKEGARKEAKGPKAKVSFRRVRSFLLYSPLTRSPRSSSMHQSAVFVIYFLHSHNPYSEAFMRKKPREHAVHLFAADVSVTKVQLSSVRTLHGCYHSIPVPHIPIPRLENAHTILRYACFSGMLCSCVYPHCRYQDDNLFFYSTFCMFTFALHLGLIIPCYSARTIHPYHSVIPSNLICVCSICCPVCG